jgi:hypothetical protein
VVDNALTKSFKLKELLGVLETGVFDAIVVNNLVYGHRDFLVQRMIDKFCVTVERELK